MWKSEQDIRDKNPDMVAQPPLSEFELRIVAEFAKQLHLAWGVARLDRGFSYGPIRTETTHPNLQQNLPEAEKQLDREDAATMLRVLKGMGYKLVKDET